MAAKTTVPYENNPFMIGIEGLQLIFKQAKGVGIYSIVMTASMFLLGIVIYAVITIVQLIASGGQEVTYVDTATPTTAELLSFGAWLLAGTLLYMVISLLLFGVLEYAAAQTAKGKNVTLKEGFSEVWRQFPAYLWMYIIFTVKVFLWSLLFIVPGIIMFNRYLLSGTVFFAEGKRGNAAIKRSAELTKGAWLTTYGGAFIWNIVSQGLAALVFWPGSMAILYRQLAAKTDSGEVKPPAHLLSWATLLVPLILAFLYIVFMVLLFALIASAPMAP